MMSKRKKIWLYIMGSLYVLAGLNHFIHPQFYMEIMPRYLPYHYALVLLGGLAELVFGIGIMTTRFRNLSAWGLILLLITIYPANIQMAIDYYRENNPGLWIALLRLPLQFVLIWWAYVYTDRYLRRIRW